MQGGYRRTQLIKYLQKLHRKMRGVGVFAALLSASIVDVAKLENYVFIVLFVAT
jgi:hypothetical protein